MLQLWTDILDILKAPFVGDLDLIHLFLLIGVVLIFAAAWFMIMDHLLKANVEI
jgi:hypothetical protein